LSDGFNKSFIALDAEYQPMTASACEESKCASGLDFDLGIFRKINRSLAQPGFEEETHRAPLHKDREYDHHVGRSDDPSATKAAGDGERQRNREPSTKSTPAKDWNGTAKAWPEQLQQKDHGAHGSNPHEIDNDDLSEA
jgi:hypothetical protein